MYVVAQNQDTLVVELRVLILETMEEISQQKLSAEKFLVTPTLGRMLQPHGASIVMAIGPNLVEIDAVQGERRVVANLGSNAGLGKVKLQENAGALFALVPIGRLLAINSSGGDVELQVPASASSMVPVGAGIGFVAKDEIWKVVP